MRLQTPEMDSNVPAGSTLNRPNINTPEALSDEQKAKVERDRRNFGIAVYHANKIQNQKNIIAQILSHIEALLELPASPIIEATEANRFARLVQIFQPSDYDSLVEERRSDGKCGYTLCLETPRCLSLGKNAAWKLKTIAAGDYCGNDCMRKSLFVKTQLSEVPAWEREPGQQPAIVLRENDQLASNAPHSFHTSDARQRLANDYELALERGETAQSLKPKQVMTDRVVEKATVRHNLSDTRNASNIASHRSIEGYEPKRVSKHLPERGEADDRREIEVAPEYGHVGRTEDDDVEESWREMFKNVGNT